MYSRQLIHQISNMMWRHLITWRSLETMVLWEGNRFKKLCREGCCSWHSRERKTLGTEIRTVASRARKREGLITKAQGTFVYARNAFYLVIGIISYCCSTYNWERGWPHSMIDCPLMKGKFYYNKSLRNVIWNAPPKLFMKQQQSIKKTELKL